MFFHVDGKMSPSSRICKNAGKQVEPAFLGTRLPPLWTPIGRAPLILTLFSSPPNLKKSFGEWCNGSTADSGSACLGSNPSSPASIKPEMPVDTTISKMYWQQSGNSFPVTLGWRCHPKEGNQWRPSKNAAAHGASSSASVDCSIS